MNIKLFHKQKLAEAIAKGTLRTRISTLAQDIENFTKRIFQTLVDSRVVEHLDAIGHQDSLGNLVIGGWSSTYKFRTEVYSAIENYQWKRISETEYVTISDVPHYLPANLNDIVADKVLTTERDIIEDRVSKLLADYATIRNRVLSAIKHTRTLKGAIERVPELRPYSVAIIPAEPEQTDLSSMLGCMSKREDC